MTRSLDKKKEIERFLEELEIIFPKDFEIYSKNLEKRLASERTLEKIIEAINDLAIIILKEKRLIIPSEDTRVFDILAEKNIITFQLSEKLKRAKGMRNFLVHQYGKIDDEVIFNAIEKQIFKDVREFLGVVI